MKQAKLTFYLIFVILFSVLTITSSCKDDDPLTPEELIAQNPQAAWRNCGLGSRFQRDVPDGPCLRCNTEAGYIASGRNGGFCHDPNDLGAKFARMVLFDSLPNNWWPSDTLYFANSSASAQEADMNSFGTGIFSTLGVPLDETSWIPEDCPFDGADDPSRYSRGGMSFIGFKTNSQRYGLFNGDNFEFTVTEANINDDCWADWGYVSGYTIRDTSFATVTWRINRPFEMWGDTLLTSTFIMVEPPEWISTW
ncbi:MAG: hypothetical protein AB8F78_08610 [Saprospiraceae bacterium]